jgi:hypothetical protein
MLVCRWITEIRLIGCQQNTVLSGCNGQNVRISRAYSEIFNVDDSDDIVSVVAESLYPLRLDVFVREKLHRTAPNWPRQE